MYENEPQGEAVCWDTGSTGYYTVSEELEGIPTRLYFYPRLVSKHHSEMKWMGFTHNCELNLKNIPE